MAINILALILVVLFLWGAIWLFSYSSKKKRLHNKPLDGDFEARWDYDKEAPSCPVCQGTGAKNKLGTIQTCHVCDGMGVISSASLDN